MVNLFQGETDILNFEREEMKFPINLTDEQVKQLEFEVLSKDFYIFLTRHLLKWAEDAEYAEDIIARKNRIINLSRTISGGKIYTLESDDMGSYQPAEYVWHDSHFLLILRRLNTLEFIEFASELMKAGYFELEFLNAALQREGASFEFIKADRKFGIEVYSLEEIEAVSLAAEHINIKTLVSRMDKAFEADDFAGVLHSSASIFETMAKEVIGIESIQDKTLKSFFDRYRNDSKLPPAILDYILATYDERNVTPLAGHGSLTIPDITKEESIILSEMTKAFVRIESRLKREI
jgi:hypothetical protein